MKHKIVKETVLERNYTPYGWIVVCSCGWRARADYLDEARKAWAVHADQEPPDLMTDPTSVDDDPTSVDEERKPFLSRLLNWVGWN